MHEDRLRALKVGGLVLVALLVFAVGLFVIGERNNLFSLKNTYFARFGSVSGLNDGSPVQLNGVKVGTVRRVVLPEDPGESRIRVEFSLDRRYAERVRADSEASIKTIGLLGDKYVEISSGTSAAAIIPSGGEVSAAPSSIDALVASGEDVMANVIEISASLKVLLARAERGEGVLGQLLADTETGAHVTDKVMATLDSVQHAAERIESGAGVLPRLITDAALADRLASSVAHLEAVTAKLDNGPGLVPSLLSDAEMKQQFTETLTALKSAAGDLAAFSGEVRGAKGLLPRLLFDEKYGDALSARLDTTLQQVDVLSSKLNAGDGTLARLINDPSLYEAMQDIVVGVNDSRMLRWLIRNRQKQGIEKRYQDAQRDAATPPPAAPP